MGILERWLSKKTNGKGLPDLNEEERATFEKYQAILSDGEITVDKVAQFCENQIKVIEKQWKNLDNPKEKNDRLIIFHTVYSTLLEVIRSPQQARETLEKYLEGQL